MRKRVLFHVQHLLGVGHLRRAEILAKAMAEAGLDVTLALGGQPVAEVPFRGINIVQLPPATIADEDFSRLLDGAGKPVGEEWKANRASQLLDLWRRFDPHVVLIELFPFGRRQFRFELLPLLEAIHASARRPRVACSVRDILVASKTPGRSAEAAKIVRRSFDAVLVHGDPDLIPFDASFDAADEISDLIRYTGYVTDVTPQPAPLGGHGEVVVSAGGGAVGAPLLFAALEARPRTPLAGNVWRLLAGPNLPDEAYDRLAAMADDRTIVERFRPDFAARLPVAALSISQGGYNTIMDILRSGARAVIVPYESPGETEQRLRADFLAAKGLVTVVAEAGLSPESLAQGIAACMAKPPSGPTAVDLSGAATTARLVAELADRPSASA